MTALDRARALIAETEGHTPGPWEPYQPDDELHLWNVFIPVMENEDGGMDGPIMAERVDEPDARLIAAAPDLRAALAEMVAEVESLQAALEREIHD